MQLCHMSQVIDISSKSSSAAMVFIYLTHFFLPFLLSNISSCQNVKIEEMEREWGHMINILCFYVCFHSLSLHPCFPFGLLHISISSLSVFTFLSLYYICFLSFSLCLLPLCIIATPPCPILLSDIFFFPSRGLRPAVAVWFELFQVFSQQQVEIVMVLAGCVPR